MTDIKVTIIGVGGAGCNTINRLSSKKFKHYNLLAVNTDTQMLETINHSDVFALGPLTTKGFGSGGNPRIGRLAAKESSEQFSKLLEGQDLVILTTGLGGGTGTGATPVLASMAKKMGALVIVIATHPFNFEGQIRAQYSEKAVKSLIRSADSLIEINNDGLLGTMDKKSTIDASFKYADSALVDIVEEITTVIGNSGLINIDFADIKNLLTKSGKTYVSKSRINKSEQIDTIHENLKQNLLINYGFRSSRRLLLSIKSSPDFSLNELNLIATKVSSFLYNPENILIGVNNTFFKKSIIEATLIASDLKFSFTNDTLPVEPKSFSYVSSKYSNAQSVNDISNSNDNAIKTRILNLRKLIKIPIGFN